MMRGFLRPVRSMSMTQHACVHTIERKRHTRYIVTYLPDQRNNAVDALEEQNLGAGEAHGDKYCGGVVLNRRNTRHLHRELQDVAERETPEVAGDHK